MGLKTEKIFFQLLRCEMNETTLCEEIKNLITLERLPALFKLAKQHDLAHLVGDALDKNGLLPENTEARKRFLQERNMAIYRYEQIQYELGEICRILEEAKIQHVPLKGSVLRKYYLEPWMRTSCDIDILVKQDCLETAISVLENHGYKYETTEAYDAHLWSPGGVHLELHFNLMSESIAKKSAKVLSNAWERVKPCEGWEYRLQFDEAFFYFYHIAHMAKHFLTGGCGIRPFLDVWILNKIDIFNSKETEKLLKEAGVFTFEQNAERLANVWLSGAEHDDLTKEMEDYIVGAGVYGSLDNSIALRQVREGGKSKHLLSRIFLPYSALKITYPKLKKYPILFPFYQVVRWCRILFGKSKKRAFTELKGIATMNDEKKNYLSTLCNDLGLKQ